MLEALLIQNLFSKFKVTSESTKGIKYPILITAVKAESIEFVELCLMLILHSSSISQKQEFLKFLLTYKVVITQAKGPNHEPEKIYLEDTFFTLLMKDISKKFENCRKLLITIIFQVSKKDELPKWFHDLLYQLIDNNSSTLDENSMAELIELFTEVQSNITFSLNLSQQNDEHLENLAKITTKLDFVMVLTEETLLDDNGNNILMCMAMHLKDDALREFLTNPETSRIVGSKNLKVFLRHRIHFSTL